MKELSSSWETAECKIFGNVTLACHLHSSKRKWRSFKRKIFQKNKTWLLFCHVSYAEQIKQHW